MPVVNDSIEWFSWERLPINAVLRTARIYCVEQSVFQPRCLSFKGHPYAASSNFVQAPFFANCSFDLDIRVFIIDYWKEKNKWIFCS